MRLKKIDICDRFIPLIINLVYILLLSFNLTIDGFNILVNSNYFIATYIYLGLVIVNYLISIILHKKYYFMNRSFLFFLFLILGLSISPKIGGFQYFHTFMLLFSVVDVIMLLFKMVYDSYYTEERIKTLVLPPNQFNKSRKVLSRILNSSGFIIFFIICLVVFYFNEVKVTSILILLLVGLILVSIIQIISMSVSVSPMNKYIRKYESTLDIKALEESLESLKDVNLHNETLNMLNIILWKYYSFIDITKANKYKELVFKPSNDYINKLYFDAYFYYLLVTKDYNMIVANKKTFIKNVRNKKYVRTIIAVLNNNYVKYKGNKKLFDNILVEIYNDLSSKLINFNDYNYIKFNIVELENIYNDIYNKLSNYHTLNEYKEILEEYNTINNKIVGATKLSSIKLFSDYSYYNEYVRNISLVYDLYPTISNINNLICESRFNKKAKDIYGPYYLKHLNNFSFPTDYSDIKNSMIKEETISFDNDLSVLDKYIGLVNIRNDISIKLGFNNYLDVLYYDNNQDIINDINISDYSVNYCKNTKFDVTNINDNTYKEYLSYLKKHNLYCYKDNVYNYTYYINNYRAPFISINSSDLDYNHLYFELGKGYTYYLNNQSYIPKYLLDFSGYLNVTILTANLDFVLHELNYYYNLYNEYINIYNNEVKLEYFSNLVLDVNPLDKLLACLMVIKLFEGDNNLLKVFISLNRNLYKTSEKELFSSLGLSDLYDKYITK